MAETKSAREQTHFKRFAVSQRIEHAVLLLSFFTLGLTGLIQKYALTGIASWLIGALGGIEAVRIIHRVAAIIFALLSVYHVMVLGYKIFVLRIELTMLPGLKDLIDAIDVVRYNMGLTKEHPKMPRYNFAEKVEYWAMLWGGIVMGLTGFMLWNPIATSKFLPGQFIPAAKAAHGGEAVLAVLAILIWHFYSVHIKTFNKSMFTGKMTRHQMDLEHGDELRRILAGTAKRQVDPEGVRRRQRIYVPIAAGVGLVAALGLIWFATFEETAVATVPALSKPEAVFAPLTPTPLPISTVDNRSLGAAIPHPVEGQENCEVCHAVGALNPYPANHEGRPVESCLICHQPGGEAPAGRGASGIPHPIEGDVYKDCTSCHGEGKLKPVPANHANFTNANCIACHDLAADGGTPGASAIPHPVEGDVYKNCANCHGEGKLRPFPANHASFTDDSCTACHALATEGETPAAGGAAGPIPHPVEGDVYKNCANCHGEGKLKPFPANHASFTDASCTACHALASDGGAPAAGGAAGPIPHPVEGDVYKNCANCHGEGKLKPFPANHVSFAADSCTACHQPAP